MRNIALYILTVLIWGSTWFAIEFQLGEIAIEVSLVYRFALAALIMWVYCLLARVPLQFSCRNHAFILLLALGNFSINYMFMYLAQESLTSAAASIAFSTMLLMNIINSRLFFGTPIERRVYFAALLGILGLILLFWQDLQGQNSIYGLILVLTGTLIASLGNMVSVRNSRNNLNVFAVNAWGMLYGCLFLSLWALLIDSEFTFSWQPAYVISLVYLAVFGTVIAFASYFLLLANIGPQKASYAVVLFPVIAVILSSLFEGFSWSLSVAVGFLFVLLGNIIVLWPDKTTVQQTARPGCDRDG